VKLFIGRTLLCRVVLYAGTPRGGGRGGGFRGGRGGGDRGGFRGGRGLFMSRICSANAGTGGKMYIVSGKKVLLYLSAPALPNADQCLKFFH